VSGRLERRTQELQAAGSCGIAPYVTAGDGGLQRTGEILHALERAGAACVELGVPFSDPIADGPILQAAAQRALEQGTSLTGILDCVRAYRAAGGELPIALFSYANPLIGPRTGSLATRWRAACADLKDAGVDALLVPDLPIEEGADLGSAAGEHDLAPIFFVSPTTSPERIVQAAEASRGFLYAIGRTGITGARAELGQETEAFLKNIRAATGLPIGVGFGIADAQQVRIVAQHAELAIVGSAIVQYIHEAAQRDPASSTGAAVKAAGQFVTQLQKGLPS
jgi:tryptophan synthase alpha chain